MIGKLVHYSTKPVTAIHSVEQAEFQPVGKPSGLWVSTNDVDDYREVLHLHDPLF